MQASDILGYDLLKVCNDGEPLILLMSCSLSHVRKEIVAQPLETT